uniref:Uncharacterized protein n=1 Tax=Oryza sativa subsp. japonica TaxID=39947 RepID=Q6Z638_ORYSJ|nr:hypothetical protein [Oryza sativa Japonica Group]
MMMIEAFGVMRAACKSKVAYERAMVILKELRRQVEEEKTVADVIKGEGRRRQAGPTGQRHKGAGPPWTGTTEAVHRRSTGTDGPDRPKPIGRPGAARLGHSTAQSRLAKRRRAAARPPAATAGDSAGRRGGMLTKGGDGETTTRKPAAGSSGRQRWSGEEAVAGVRLGVADPREETAQSGVDRGGGATQMETTNTAAISGTGSGGALGRRLGRRWRAAGGGERGGGLGCAVGVVLEGWRGGNKRRPDFPLRWRSWRWRRLGAATAVAAGNGDRSSPECGSAWVGSRPDVAESAGEVGRRRGVVEGLTGADFRGESGGNGGGRGGDRAHVVGCELGCGRAPDFAATWTAMAVGVGRREVGGGADGWDRRSHLSAKGEKEGRKTDFCERAK